MRAWFTTPTTLQWITLGIALFALGLAVGYVLGEIYGVRMQVWIYNFNPGGGHIPSWGL